MVVNIDSSRRRSRSALRGEVAEVFRRAILEAAERIFGARGFADARMAEIAAQAGLAAGTLYNYFDSKESIFRALVEQRGEELLARLEGIAARRAKAREKLVELASAMFEYIESHSAMLTLLLEQAGAAEERGAGACALRTHQQFLALFERAITQAIREGVVRRDLSAGELAQALTGSLRGLVRGWLIAGARSGRLASRAGFVVELFLDGAGVRP